MMRKTFYALMAGGALVAVAFASGLAGRAQGARAQERGERSAAVSKIEDRFFAMPVPSADQTYASIDGKHMHGYVVEQAAISRRYRDAGHPQFWGRIIGSASDAESA